jgi:hypothetical protein
MPMAFDLARELRAGLGDRQATWRFIRHFADSWLTPLAEGDGCGGSELDAAEDRLGLRLPAALREAYGLFGRRPDLTSNQDTLLAPDALYLDAGGDALVFRVENQEAARWGVPTHDLDLPDPPVVIKLDLRQEQSESWEPWLDTFSSACLEIVLSESLYACEELGDNRDEGNSEADRLTRQYARLPLPDYPTSLQLLPSVRWFAGPDVVLRDDQQAWLTVRARTVAALEKVRRELPGPWLMAEDE